MDNLTPEQIQQMIQMLQSMLPKDTVSTEKNTDIKPAAKPKKKEQRINKFDEMQEARLHKDDIVIDKALSVYKPTPRTRKFEPIEAICRVCGKKEMVNPSILNDSGSRFKCNNCARSPG